MTDELDSTQTGTEGSQPEGSKESGSGGSFDPRKLQETFEEFKKQLAEVDARTRSLQGDKDRSVNKTRKEVEELRKQLAEIDKFKQRGMSEEEAIEEYELRQSLLQLREQSQPSVGSAAVDVEKVISEYGLDASNPAVKLAFDKQFKSVEEAELTAARLLKPKPTPTAAQQPAQPANPVKTDDNAALAKGYKAELESIMKANGGRPNPTAIADLKAQYRKKGLEVW